MAVDRSLEISDARKFYLRKEVDDSVESKERSVLGFHR